MLTRAAEVESRVQFPGASADLVIRGWQTGTAKHLIILIHGSGEGSHIWRTIAPALRASGSVIALDMRGHGTSDWDPLGRYELDDYVGDMLTIIDHVSDTAIYLVGHSMGARIALRTAARIAPGRICGLVLADMAYSGKQSSSDYNPTGAVKVPNIFRDIGEFIRVARIMRPNIPVATIEAYASHILKQTGSALEYVGDPLALDFSNQDDPRRELRDLACRAHIIRGQASSRLSSAAAEELRRCCPYGTSTVIAGAGHDIVGEQPERLSAAITKFIAEA